LRLETPFSRLECAVLDNDPGVSRDDARLKAQGITMLTRRKTLLWLGGLGMALPPRTAWAQQSRNVRLIVPAAPGGAIDAIGRLYADRLKDTLGQTWVVENRAGANNTLGAAEVARAAPDRHVASDQCLTDVIGGQTTLMVAPLGSALQQIQAGNLRAFAVMSEQRVPQLPSVPTMGGPTASCWRATWRPAV
jgi:tripartite-type tricarboxylate transporter receptor subunit TctC